MKGADQRKTILFITQGNRDHASSRIRCLQYFPFLEKSGFRCIWLPRIPVRRNSFFNKNLIFPVLKRINRLRIILGILFLPYRVLFIQRIFLPEWLLKKARKKTKKIIFDFDDAIYLSDTDKKAGFKTLRMIEHSDLIIVSSPVLKEYAASFHKRVEMITSPVAIQPVEAASGYSETRVIGWVGSEWTGKYLNMLSEVFEKLQSKYPVHFLFVGCPAGMLPAIRPEIIPWSPDSDGKMLSRMDIGIMPLTDTPFERGKGGYKLLQYMAAGKPVVASPVGINNQIVTEGENGFLCKDPGEWFAALEKLLLDTPLRERMGNAGYRLVKEKYSLEVCYKKLVNVLDEIYLVW